MGVPEKSLLRREAIRLLRSSVFPPGPEIANAIRARADYRKARNLFAFCPLRTEPDVGPLVDRALEDGKAVWLPVCLGPDQMEFARVEGADWRRSLSRHPNGTLVPPSGAWADLSSIGATLVLVPGLLFTRTFHRLGRGGGYYDAFLARIQDEPDFTALGVCLRTQIRDSLPLEPHDRRLDGLVVLG